MIRGERIIQINVALLILVGALLLSIAQNNIQVLIITAVGVTFSLLVVDWFRWISFHPFVVNTLAFAVSFFSFTQFMGGNTGTKLNAVASLLTYLQLVLMLQRKSPRLYWQIMMLSLLQVVVAAALNLGFGAGLVFFGYIILVVVGTIHLKIYRGNYRLAEYEKRNDARAKSLEDSNGETTDIGVMTYRAANVDFRNEKKIAWQGFLLCLVSLFFAFSVFYSIPRFGSAWYGPGSNQNQQTGFAKEIRFDDMGFLKESNRNVMRASFLDSENRPMELAIEPYFKGLILTQYMQNENDVWIWSNPANDKSGQLNQGAYYLNDAPEGGLRYIRQVVRLEPAGKYRFNKSNENHLLFSVLPAFRSEETPKDLVYNPLREILFRDANLIEHSINAPYHYETLTPLYRNLGQVPAIPVKQIYQSSLFEQRRLREYLSRLLGDSLNLFDKDWKPLKKVADTVVQELQGTKSRRMICNRLVNFLKRPEFSYTRDLGRIKTNQGIDPIVDFVLNHKTGHCEFYATALALMLRSQQIPCRLVTGYRGGDFNSIGGFYLVKEKHAHVWVEAYLRPEDCDLDMVRTGQASAEGAWLRLDPTPGSNGETVALTNTLVDRAFDAVGFAQKIWDDYVTGLDQDSRTFNGFDPTNPDSEFSWGALGFVFFQFELAVEWAASKPWWQWLIVILLLGSLTYLYLRIRIGRQLKKQGKSVTTKAVFAQIFQASINSVTRLKNQILGSPDPKKNKVDFYEDFLSLLNGYGFIPKSSQTPKEFGNHVATELEIHYPKASAKINSTIQSIVGQFYDVRYGKRTVGENGENQNTEREKSAKDKVNELRQILNAG